LKSELFAERAHVQPDATIAASGIVFRVFGTNGVVDVTIEAEDAECSREQQAGWSEKPVSLKKGDMQLTGVGFKWSGRKGTLRILRHARVTFPSEMIKTERILKRDEESN
jgi:lipopolysaccharide export system protein LptC